MLVEMMIMMGLYSANWAFNTQSGKGKADKWGMYRDGNGNYRLKQNGRWVVDTYNDYGECIIKYVRTGETAINIDEIEANQRKEEAIKDGEKVYLFRPERNCYHKLYHGNPQIKGTRYCETDNNHNLLVIRRIDCDGIKQKNSLFGYGYYGEYYMDMNYKICYPTERTRKNDQKLYGSNSDEIHKYIIEKANMKIKEYLESSEMNSWLLPNRETTTIHI